MTLTGQAMYVGYLQQCLIFADLDADGVADANEPADTTDAFGGWSLTMDESDADAAQLVLVPSNACIDRHARAPNPKPTLRTRVRVY